jgi:hypothetical protein
MASFPRRSRGAGTRHVRVEAARRRLFRKTFGDEGQLVKEREFLLQSGVAVNIKHLRRMPERVQAARLI